MQQGDVQTFKLGRFTLECGISIPDAAIVFVTHGKLSQKKDNAILVPSCFGGSHRTYDFLIGEGKALDPKKYFIVAVNMFSNGLSSSPSNTPEPYKGPHFPQISHRDNVKAYFKLMRDVFGLDQLHAVLGFSMGGQQALQWAVSFPETSKAIISICGNAREYDHGIARLEGFKRTIALDPAFNHGHYVTPPVEGLKVAGLNWAPWGQSQKWFFDRRYTELGASTLETYLRDQWELGLTAADANDLINQAVTWQRHNVGDTLGYHSDHTKALQSIDAKVLYLPSQTDLYFPPEYSVYEAQFNPKSTCVVIPSQSGHGAGCGLTAQDREFVNTTIGQYLALKE